MHLRIPFRIALKVHATAKKGSRLTWRWHSKFQELATKKTLRSSARVLARPPRGCSLPGNGPAAKNKPATASSSREGSRRCMADTHPGTPPAGPVWSGPPSHDDSVVVQHSDDLPGCEFQLFCRFLASGFQAAALSYSAGPGRLARVPRPCQPADRSPAGGAARRARAVPRCPFSPASRGGGSTTAAAGRWRSSGRARRGSPGASGSRA